METFRYWQNQSSVSLDHGTKVDRERLSAELGRLRADFGAIEEGITREGIAVIPAYWSADRCAAGRAEIDRLVSSYPQVVQKSSRGSDTRMFGVESVSPTLAEFHADRFVAGVGELIGGLTLYNFATLGARIEATPDNNGSGDGWHRDAHGFQFKSILYLSDVSEENGPFEYLPGSHKRWRAALDTAVGGLPPAPRSRYEREAICQLQTWLGTRLRSYPGEAGTLLLVNTAGIHHGRPLVAGNRYALTNYFYHSYQIDEGRIAQFSPLMPGAAERVRVDNGIV
jgi:hypothetical protein